MKFWSEVPSARLRELVADVATWAWVSLWAVVAFRLYNTLAGYAEVGRAIGRGGTTSRPPAATWVTRSAACLWSGSRCGD